MDFYIYADSGVSHILTRAQRVKYKHKELSTNYINKHLEYLQRERSRGSLYGDQLREFSGFSRVSTSANRSIVKFIIASEMNETITRFAVKLSGSGSWRARYAGAIVHLAQLPWNRCSPEIARIIVEHQLTGVTS